jgi:hypothetical protein
MDYQCIEQKGTDMKHIPMCWKCDNAVTQSQASVSGTLPRSLVLVGCKVDDRIKNYGDAEVHCPLLREMTDETEQDICIPR